MVTISLLAVALVAIISVTIKILQAEHVTENDFIAKGLMVEGLELAEAIRNNNIDKLSAFYTDLTSASPANGTTYTMRIDYTGANNATVATLTDSLCRLLYDTTNFYQYTSGSQTKFYRMLKTTYRVAGGRDYLEVESQLYWADRGKGSTQKISSVLYNTVY